MTRKPYSTSNPTTTTTTQNKVYFSAKANASTGVTNNIFSNLNYVAYWTMLTQSASNLGPQFNGSPRIFTSPRDGVYQINLSFNFTRSTNNPFSNATAAIFKNQVQLASQTMENTTNNESACMNLNLCVPLLQSDFLEIKCSADPSATIATDSCFFSITALD